MGRGKANKKNGNSVVDWLACEVRILRNRVITLEESMYNPIEIPSLPSRHANDGCSPVAGPSTESALQLEHVQPISLYDALGLEDTNPLEVDLSDFVFKLRPEDMDEEIVEYSDVEYNAADSVGLGRSLSATLETPGLTDVTLVGKLCQSIVCCISGMMWTGCNFTAKVHGLIFGLLARSALSTDNAVDSASPEEVCEAGDCYEGVEDSNFMIPKGRRGLIFITAVWMCVTIVIAWAWITTNSSPPLQKTVKNKPPPTAVDVDLAHPALNTDTGDRGSSMAKSSTTSDSDVEEQPMAVIEECSNADVGTEIDAEFLEEAAMQYETAVLGRLAACQGIAELQTFKDEAIKLRQGLRSRLQPCCSDHAFREAFRTHDRHLTARFAARHSELQQVTGAVTGQADDD